MLFLGTLASLSLVNNSCTDNDYGYSVNDIEYSKNFVNRFGEIDPDQDWGFGEKPVSNTVSAAKTRVRVNDIVVNRNQWAEKDEFGNYKEYALLPEIEIPGWPNVDGYYYYSQSDGATLYTSATLPENGLIPAGDVTNYEIEYVSRWFREHPNPTSTTLNLTDFFIQNISCDRDRNPASGEESTDKRNGDVKGADKSCDYAMDFLTFITADNQTLDVHDYNFNRNQTIKFGELGLTGANLSLRQAQYIHFEGVTNFACKASWGTDDYDVNTNTITRQGNLNTKWVLVKLEWDEPNMLDGQTHHRTGYYLAFDYYASKSSTDKVDADGYYSNWIIKITPANHTTETTQRSYAYRVMCEDLGTTDDYDFNDVVFDVVYPSATQAQITVMAAGGTLPLYIGDSSHEVHNLFGVATSEMVNTGKGPVKNPVTFTLTVSSTNPNDIPITVEGQNATYVLQAQEGKVPQKICVPSYVSWARERIDIQDAYPFFKNWVNSASNWTEATDDITRYPYYDSSKSYQNYTSASGKSGSAIPYIYDDTNTSSFRYVWHTPITGYDNSSYLYRSYSLPSNGGSTPSPQQQEETKYYVQVSSADSGMGDAYVVNAEGGNGGSQISNLSNGTEVIIKAVAKDGYEFVKWSDENTSAERTITVNGNNVSLTASFKAVETTPQSGEEYTYVSEVAGPVVNNQTLFNVTSGSAYRVVIEYTPNEGANYGLSGLGYRVTHTQDGDINKDIFEGTAYNTSITFACYNGDPSKIIKIVLYKKN